MADDEGREDRDTVLVTGGAGRVGRSVVERLDSSGWAVSILDAVEYEHPGVRSYVGDLLSADDTGRAMAGAGSIVHLAAIPRPVGSDPDTIMRTNVLGTHVLYEVAAELGIRTVVLLSSTAVVGTDWARGRVIPDYLPLDEAHPCAPQDPYGLSKVMSEEIADYAWRRSGISTIVLRAPWVVTPEDVDELAARGGRAPEGVHHYAYVTVADLARAVELALGRAESLPGVTRLFVAAPDSTLAATLAEAVPAIESIPGASDLGMHQSGVSSGRAERLLGWTATEGWRERSTQGQALVLHPREEQR